MAKTSLPFRGCDLAELSCLKSSPENHVTEKSTLPIIEENIDNVDDGNFKEEAEDGSEEVDDADDEIAVRT